MMVIFLGWTLCLSAMAGVAQDISIPVFTELRFSRDAIAIVTLQGTYRLDRGQEVRTPISTEMLATDFPPSNGVRKLTETEMTRWVPPAGAPFELAQAYCAEGTDQPHRLTRNGKPVRTYLPRCETVSSLEIVNHQLWLGSITPGELADGPGSGVRVVALDSGKLLATFKPGRDLADGYVQLIQSDPVTGDIWIATNSALHRVRNHKMVDRWYVSEKFSGNGLVSYHLSQSRRRSDPWAILVRAAGIAASHAVWQQLQHQPKLIERLSFAYDEEGNFFRVDGLIPGSQYQVVKPDYRPIPPAWPPGFEWLVEPLMTALQRTRLAENGALADDAYLAARLLCSFKDPRIGPFMLEWERAGGMTNAHKTITAGCVEMHRAIGMTIDTTDRDAALWSRMETGLKNYLMRQPGSADRFWSTLLPDMDAASKDNARRFLELVRLAVTSAPDSREVDAVLDHVFARFGDSDDALPLANVWLTHVQGNNVSRLCQYLNPRYHSSGTRNSSELTYQLILATDRVWRTQKAQAKIGGYEVGDFARDAYANCHSVVKNRLSRPDHQRFEAEFGQRLSATERELLK